MECYGGRTPDRSTRIAKIRIGLGCVNPITMMEAVVTPEFETEAKPGSAASASAVLRKRMGDNLLAIGQHQDEAAFADVYSYYGGRVKSFLMGKGMAEQIAEELTQEIMLTIWRRAESYDPKKAAASTWIFTIARNRRIDYLRGNSRIEVELDDEMLDIETTDEDTQAKYVSDAQAAEQLKQALATLPQEQRQVMHLSYFRGQSHGAIAAWLDLPIGTVKSRIRLAMQAVRAQLQDESEKLR